MSTEWLQEARDAVDGFVADLQAGIDSADADGQPIPVDDASVFSEMAMYVLVRRDRKWWSPQARTLPFARSRDSRMWLSPPLSDSVAEVRICAQRQLFATAGNSLAIR
jgi:hypothetical protein